MTSMTASALSSDGGCMSSSIKQNYAGCQYANYFVTVQTQGKRFSKSTLQSIFNAEKADYLLVLHLSRHDKTDAVQTGARSALNDAILHTF